MLFQTRKTFVPLQNTTSDISDEIRELSDPSVDIIITFKAQKDVKDIVKIVHMALVKNHCLD